MASSARRAQVVHPAWYVFWLAFLLACLYFLFGSATTDHLAEMQDGATLWNRYVWYFGHALLAAPVLLIAPLQFMPGLRQSRPAIHRWLGRLFLANCMIAGLLGVYLGATIFLPGSRVPLTLLGSLWFAFAAIAWQAARRKDFVNHRKFAIRAFALGAAFVWVRIISSMQDDIFAFMPSDDLRETTKEWLTLFLPILVTEAWFTWGAVAKKLFAPAKAKP